MTVLAIRVNEAAGVSFGEDGDLVEEEDSEFISATEAIVWVDPSDMLDIDNAIADIKDILFEWGNSSDKKSEATKAR